MKSSKMTKKSKQLLIEMSNRTYLKIQDLLKDIVSAPRPRFAVRRFTPSLRSSISLRHFTPLYLSAPLYSSAA